MKWLSLLPLAAALAFGQTGPAAAARYVLSPPATAFQFSGGGFLLGGPAGALTCSPNRTKARTSKTGHTGSIPKFTVFCNESGELQLVSPEDSPWAIEVTGPTTANIVGMAFLTENGLCGPTTIPITIDSSGDFTISDTKMAGNCEIIGKLQTSPAITIVPS